MPLRWVEVAVLLVLGWLVAVPVSAWFARVSWTVREPVAALVAWQAVGLSGGLAVLTAELTLAAAGRPGRWRDAVADSLTRPVSAGVVGTVGLLLFALSLAWLEGVLIASFVRVVRARRGHRALVELLSRPAGSSDARFDVIDSATPLAYAVPGRTSHVVVSTAAVARLDAAELAAVLAHERAHLRQRHDVLVQPFIAWERSLRNLAPATAARRRVEELVELACDDAARRTTDPRALASALVALRDPGEPAIAERLTRLTVGRRCPVLRVALVLAAVVLVLAPPAALLALPG